MAYIDSINSDDGDYLIAGVSNIVVCSTSASTVAKTATATDYFSLDSNLSFKIKFTNGNTASSPTLNLNSTGAKSLTTTTSDYTLVAGTVYDCYYNGTSYVLDNTVTVHTANTSNPHSVTKSQVGLGNCDNTADSSKSVLSASKLTTARTTYVTLGTASTTTTRDWSGTTTIPVNGTLPVANGGTGTTSVSGIKSVLGLGDAAYLSADTRASITSTNVPVTGMAIASGNGGAICTTLGTTQIKQISLNGFTLYSGATVKVTFINAHTTTSAPMLQVNFEGTSNDGSHYIVVHRNGKLYRMFSHTGYWGGASSTSTRIFDDYTTLELMYYVPSSTLTIYDNDDTSFATVTTSSGVWIVMNDPVVNSYVSSSSSYEVKANGLIEQWGFTETNNNVLMIYYTTDYVVTGAGFNISRAGLFPSTKTNTTLIVRCTKDGDSSHTADGGYWQTYGY